MGKPLGKRLSNTYCSCEVYRHEWMTCNEEVVETHDMAEVIQHMAVPGD